MRSFLALSILALALAGCGGGGGGGGGPKVQRLYVNGTGDGSVLSSPDGVMESYNSTVGAFDGVERYTRGTDITITVTPADGWYTSSTDITGNVTSTSANTFDVDMTIDCELNVAFDPIPAATN